MKATAMIHEIPAGIQLDEMVANLLGMRVAKRKSGNSKVPVAYRWQSRNGYPVFWTGGGFFGWGWSDEPSPPPRFSEDMNWALSALEQWEGDFKLTRRNGQWNCELFKPSEEWEAWGETAPLAIARVLVIAVRKTGRKI